MKTRFQEDIDEMERNVRAFLTEVIQTQDDKQSKLF